MDIMQKVCGDSQNEKIEKAIRGCHVLISCVTSTYALSANCKQEVGLAHALNKPIIALLLEPITWPPEGPMCMVFTELMYIDCCRPKVEIQDDWNCEQFQELLGKIEGHVPDGEKRNIEKKPAVGNSKDTKESNDAKNSNGASQPSAKDKETSQPKSDGENKSGACTLL